MAFTFAAFAYIVALIVDALLIFFAIFHVSQNFDHLEPSKIVENTSTSDGSGRLEFWGIPPSS